MKKWTWLFLVLFLVGLSGCGTKANVNQNSAEYIVSVYATEGLRFSGSIGGGGNSRTIEGTGIGQTNPLNFNVVGWPAVAVIQKMDAEGSLLVVIKSQYGGILNQQSTDAQYGVVTVSSG